MVRAERRILWPLRCCSMFVLLLMIHFTCANTKIMSLLNEELVMPSRKLYRNFSKCIQKLRPLLLKMKRMISQLSGSYSSYFQWPLSRPLSIPLYISSNRFQGTGFLSLLRVVRLLPFASVTMFQPVERMCSPCHLLILVAASLCTQPNLSFSPQWTHSCKLLHCTQ